MTETTKNKLGSIQLSDLKKFGYKVNKFNADFAVYGIDGQQYLFCESESFESDFSAIENNCAEIIREYKAGKNIVISGENFLATVLQIGYENVAVAYIDITGLSSVNRPNELSDKECLAGILELFAGKFQVDNVSRSQMEKIGSELSYVYEELSILHKLSSNMKVTEHNSNFLQMACDSLTDLVHVEGIAVLLEKVIDDSPQLVLAAGSGLIDIDSNMAAILHSRLVEEIKQGKEALLDSDVETPYKYIWLDNVKSIMAVPLFGKNNSEMSAGQSKKNGSSITGFMVAVNRLDKPDFDSIDMKLFNSVANGCAVFVDNSRLFKDLKELFIGSLKALVSSIDAKDKYTRGHSERVAFISKWIAERLAEKQPIDSEEIHIIYLSGLLHDVGKMGVSESVLCKKGRLTDSEFDNIKRHPTIGANILSGIKQMRNIVQGVLCHHERIDGKGYPNGLSGDKVPFIGKIISLADSFDAMTSKRVYRDAMTIEQAIAEIEKGLGTQFDEEIGRVFVDSDIYQMWDIMQNAFSDMNQNKEFSDYGAAAVGTLLK